MCTTPSPILQKFDLGYVNVLCTTPSPILQKFDLKICQGLVYYTFAYPAKVWLKDMSMSCVLHLRLSCKGGLTYKNVKGLTWRYVNVLCTTPSPILQTRFDLLICQCLVYYTFACPATVWLKDMSMSCVLHLRLILSRRFDLKNVKGLTWRYVNVLCTIPSPILQRRCDLKICQYLVHYTFAYPAKTWLKDMSMSCVLHLRLSCKSLT